MHNSQNFFKKINFVDINLPEGKFFHPTEREKKLDLICVLQNQFLDRIKTFNLIPSEKLEEFRYLCESYFDFLNVVEDNYIEEDDYEGYL